MTAILALSGLLVTLGARAKPALAQLGPPEIETVRFLGNETFPGDSLARAIVTRETGCKSGFLLPLCVTGVEFAIERHYLRAREIPRDRVRLEIWYRQRGFREVVVDTVTSFRDDGKAEVAFTVDEGRPVLVEEMAFTGEVAGDGSLLIPDLLTDLPLREGDPLNMLRLDATRDTLRERLRNQGYAHADVFRQSLIPADRPYGAEVTFDLDAGARAHYGSISVSGNENLDESTVLRTLQFRAGDLYRAGQLLDAQGRLFDMGIVRSAEVSADLQAAADSLVPIDVSVQEGDAYRVRAGSGWTSSECMNAESSWTSRNFFGGGRTLRIRGRVSNILTRQFGDLLCGVTDRSGPYERLTWLASVDFSQPWIFSTRNSFSASVFAERQGIPNTFIRRAVGIELALTRAIGPRTPLTLSYRPERSQLEAAEVLFCTGFLVCTPEDIAILGGTNTLAPVGLTFTRDRSDDLLNPRRGYRLNIDLEHAAAWTASNFRYDRVAVEGSSYTPLDDVVLAARLRAGWVGSGGFNRLIRADDEAEIVHPQKRFYSGGASSVRGFAQGRLGPRVLTIDDPQQLVDPVDAGGAGCTPEALMDLSCDGSALDDGSFVPRPTGGSRVLEGNLELRFGLGGSFEGVAFGDFGQVWAASGDVSLRDLEFTPGVGVRFLSPVGPIRVDLGYRFRRAVELPVITSRIEEAEPEACPSGGSPPPGCIEYEGTYYVRSGELGILSPLVSFGDSRSRFQLHFSIGQAF
ncbi:MAG: BamA/TamA family outer membrane protein [Gemmatimonadota bacterium]|nr:BamA/TamA family outer membrane protein [Gemmatimonadota bacterium]